MRFTDSFLDEIRNRVPVSDVVGRRVKLIRKGREFSGLCPFHNEKTPSFTVNDDKGFYHCFGCGAHGDVIGFTMRTEGLSFPEAVEKMAGEAGLPMPKSTPQERERAERAKTLIDANEAACRWFEKMLRAPEGRAALDYLRGRGLTEETIGKFRLGYAPEGRDKLKQALSADGYDEALLIEAGLVGKPDDGRATYDRFRGRVIFPITDNRDRVVAFGGRILGDGQPKYLNSPETPVFNKGRMLYALSFARKAATKDAPLIVTEGYMDVIALNQAGFEGAVAPLGTAMTEAQIELLWRYGQEPVLCFDGDAAGQRAAARAVERALPLLQPGYSLRFAILPAGEDPDSLVQGQGPDSFRKLLEGARPLVDMIWEIETAGRKFETPERRAALRKALRGKAALIPDRSVQGFYFDEFEARLNRAFRPGAPAGRRSYDRDRGRRNWPPRFPLPWYEQYRDPGLKSDGNVDVLRLRREQALVATLLTHPEMLDDIAESFAEFTFSAGGAELDKIRQEILLKQASGLDSNALLNHLRELGFSALLERILCREVFELAPFARPGTDLAAAKAGWRQLSDSYLQRTRMERELDAARHAFATDPTERNWAFLDALKRQATPQNPLPDEGADGEDESTDQRTTKADRAG